MGRLSVVGLYLLSWAGERKACETERVFSSTFLFKTSTNFDWTKMRQHIIKYDCRRSVRLVETVLFPVTWVKNEMEKGKGRPDTPAPGTSPSPFLELDDLFVGKHDLLLKPLKNVFGLVFSFCFPFCRYYNYRQVHSWDSMSFINIYHKKWLLSYRAECHLCMDTGLIPCLIKRYPRVPWLGTRDLAWFHTSNHLLWNLVHFS